METLTVPHPDDLQRRIEACEAELKALRKMQRLADAALAAEEARRRRDPTSAASEEVEHV
jgi:hypothetical protein